jgi:hypothetical protein
LKVHSRASLRGGGTVLQRRSARLVSGS